MPLYKRQIFVPNPPPKDLKDDEEVFYLKMTNEIFRDYDEYFARVIQCNSLVWSCSLTGKINMTFQEAADSEKEAKKQIKGIPKELITPLLYLMTLTRRGKILDSVEEVYTYTKERYFKGETVHSVIGSMWCPSRVISVIYPTQEEIDAYKKEQIEKGEATNNDYLDDDSWGPHPDIFRYEVAETEPDDPNSTATFILEAIDVKRVKSNFSKDKCRCLIKLLTYYDETSGIWKLKEDVITSTGIDKKTFEDYFTGKPPYFEPTPLPVVSKSKMNTSQKEKGSPTASVKKDKVDKDNSQPQSSSKKSKSKSKEGKDKDEISKGKEKVEKGSKPKKSKASTAEDKDKKKEKDKDKDKSASKKNNSKKKSMESSEKSSGKLKNTKITDFLQKVPKGSQKDFPKNQEPKKKKEKVLTPEELKKIELAKKAREREMKKEEKKLIADFKKAWYKPKEDLEVEDLKDLPSPDPIICKIPNHLFGDFVMVLEYFSIYSSVLKVRDSFPYGLTFDVLITALIKNEIAGAFSDILQMLIRAIFRLQEQENAEINAEAAAAEQDQDEKDQDDFSVDTAIQQATQASTWSILYQNTPMHKLAIDHFSISEILRLHLLSSGSNPSDKDGKYRWQNRGCYESRDDPGLYLRMEEPQIIKTLAQGTVFDLSITERLKVLNCLLNQIMTYVSVRDIMDESFEQFKQNKLQLRSLQAAEKRKDIEDQLWRNRLRYDRQLPDMNALKAAGVVPNGDGETNEDLPPIITANGEAGEGSEAAAAAAAVKKNTKPLLTEEEIEAAIAKKDKEIARRKQDYDNKHYDLSVLIHKHEKKLSISPIGRDRAFRRFWMFDSIPGVFVEHDDEYVGMCPPQPTPFLTNINLDDPKFIQENINKVKPNRDKEGSDKENSPKKLSKKKSKECLTQNGTGTGEQPLPTPKIFGVCSGDSQSCPVHCTYLPKHKWSFFWNKEQIDELIEGLSPRGIREKDLKEYLTNEKDYLVKLLAKCPYEKLNTEKEFPVIVDEKNNKRPTRGGTGGSTLPKNHLDPNLNFPTGTSLETILELQLRDLILETEEKIFLGALGSLKVQDRTSWRSALCENRSYDKQAELKWGYSSKKKSSTLNSVNTSSEMTGSDNNLAAGAVDKSKSNPNSGRNTPEPFQQPQSKKDSISKFKEREESRPTSRSSSVSSSCSNGNLKDVDLSCVNPVVKDLASAILQIEQCIEAKFLKKPLGLEKDDDKKKKSSKGSNDVENVMKGKTLEGTAIERWETSLMSCTNFSQLFLHLFTLDNSIEWARSVLNARCRVCRRKGDSENMLLCDGCNKGHHLYCLKPPITVIPKEDWFCVDCKPAEEMPKLSRARKSFIEEEDLLDSSDEENELEAKSLDDSVDESCTVCGGGGELLICDGCNSGTHMDCLDPPKTRVPRGDWFCYDCTHGSKKRKAPTNRDSGGGRGKKRKGKSQGGGRRKVSRRDDSSDEEDESESEEEEEVEESDNENEESAENDDEDGSENDESQDRSNGVIETDEDENEDDEENENEDTPVTKIKFGNKKKASTSPSFGRAGRAIIESDEESDDDPGKSRNKRSAKTSHRIHKRSKVMDNDTSDNSSSESNFGRRKRSSAFNSSREVQHSKRTRMNNNIDDGQLNNVVLGELINDLLKHDEAWPFVKPVNKREVPDYLEKIKHPMDLGTIKHKLNIMSYTMNEEFFSDLQLVFSNCMEYNEPSSDVYRSGVKLRTYCEKKVKKLGFQWGGDDIE